jgi:hypothetical protein
VEGLRQREQALQEQVKLMRHRLEERENILLASMPSHWQPQEVLEEPLVLVSLPLPGGWSSSPFFAVWSASQQL